MSERIVGQVEEFLQGVIEGLEPGDEPSGRGRPRVLPSLCLWAGMLVCVLRGFSSQLSLWRLLSHQGLWSYPRFGLTDQAVYKRLAQGGTGPLEHIFEHVSQLLRIRLQPLEDRGLAGFAKAVVAIDETTLDKVARKLPALREVPVEELLPGKLAGLFDVRLQQWLRVEHVVDAHRNGKVGARGLLEGVEAGTLVLADLGHFGFEWFDDLTDGGYHWVSRLRAKTSYEVLHPYYRGEGYFDGLVWLGKYRADRAKHAVRLVKLNVGASERVYITNVVDPQMLPIGEVAKLYARRWDFELAVKTIKQHLGLHLLWSSKQVVVQQQVWAVLIIAQVLSALRFEVAQRAEADVFDVSMQLLIRWMPEFAAKGQDPVRAFVEIGREAMFIRPSRRLKPGSPPVAQTYTPLPRTLNLQRQPRYAHHNCRPR